jgi:hypothetical protein
MITNSETVRIKRYRKGGKKKYLRKKERGHLVEEEKNDQPC